MDRADGAGLGAAMAGHVALFGALSLGLAAAIPPKPVPPPSMEVEFVEEIALQSATAQPSPQEQAAAVAPEIGRVDEAMPAPAPLPEPLPAPPPTKTIMPEKPAPAKAVAAKVKPETAKAKPLAKAKTEALPTAKSTKPEKTAARAPRIGKDFLAGLSDPSPGTADTPAAAVMSAVALADIQAAIKRQIQPCADRQVNPGPGASRITVKLNLRLNRDGSLASAPRVVSASGVDDENSRYEKRVADLAIAAYKGCAPLKGLPDDLYRTAKGGWSNVNMNYKLPG